MENREAIVALLEDKISKSKKSARRNYRNSFACHVLAILASLVATIIAATSAFSGATVAVFTAIPGTALLLNSVLAFDKKNAWHRRRTHFYQSLIMAVKFESKLPSVISRELRQFDEEIEEDYPSFGVMSHKPKD